MATRFSWYNCLKIIQNLALLEQNLVMISLGRYSNRMYSSCFIAKGQTGKGVALARVDRPLSGRALWTVPSTVCSHTPLYLDHCSAGPLCLTHKMPVHLSHPSGLATMSIPHNAFTFPRIKNILEIEIKMTAGQRMGLPWLMELFPSQFRAFDWTWCFYA